MTPYLAFKFLVQSDYNTSIYYDTSINDKRISIEIRHYLRRANVKHKKSNYIITLKLFFRRMYPRENICQRKEGSDEMIERKNDVIKLQTMTSPLHKNGCFIIKSRFNVEQIFCGRFLANSEILSNPKIFESHPSALVVLAPNFKLSTSAIPVINQSI